MKKTMMWNPQSEGYNCMPNYAPGAGGEKATPQPSGGSGGSNRTVCQTYTRAHPDGQMDGCGWSAGGNGYTCIPSYAPGAGGDKSTPQPSGGSGVTAQESQAEQEKEASK